MEDSPEEIFPQNNKKKKKRCNQQRSIRDPDDGNSASCIPNETRPSLPPDERLIGDVAEIIDR